MLGAVGEEMEIAALERQIQAEIEAEEAAIRQETQRLSKLQKDAAACDATVEDIAEDLTKLAELLNEFTCYDQRERLVTLPEQIQWMAVNGGRTDFPMSCIEDVDEERVDLANDIDDDLDEFHDYDCKDDDRFYSLRESLDGINLAYPVITHTHYM